MVCKDNFVANYENSVTSNKCHEKIPNCSTHEFASDGEISKCLECSDGHQFRDITQ